MSPVDILPLFNILLALVLIIVVLGRNPRVLVTKAFGMGACTVVIVELGHFLARISSQASGVLFWYKFALAGLCFLPMTWSLFSCVVFQPRPDEIMKKRRGYLLFISIISAGFFIALITDHLVWFPRSAAAPWLGNIRFTALGRWFLIYQLLTAVVMLVTLENTYRRVRRRGGRHALYGLMSGLFYLVFLSSQGLLYSRIPSPAVYLGSAVVAVSGMLIAYDIIRNRLLQVNIYVGRGAVYSSAILFLVGLYLVLMGLVAKLVKIIGGNLGLFLTILAAFLMLFMLLALLLSGSLKKRVKVFIDRNFYRGRYDYREQWLRFSEEMSSLLNLDVIVARFLQMTLQTVDSRKGCVLLPETSGGDFQVVEAVDLDGAQMHISEHSDFLDWIFVLSQPIELDDVRFERKTAHEISVHRDRFRNLGIAVLVPLISKRKLIGLLALGPSRSGDPYSSVDLELLEAIGNHLSMAILNARLSQELVINRELEFMHKVSSFVVHDLKNSVSTLSMLLHNAVHNIEDPEFQKSMLLTINGTVEKMNDLMGKIRTMPKDVELNKQPQDINRIVRDVISRTKVGQQDRVRYIEDLQDVPLTQVDREYLERILTNLIINALEAVSGEGTLRVSTRVTENGALGSEVNGKEAGRCVQIEVADNGSGMSSEFLKNRLFRPFQTTKKKGLGIGLYQCREAVEAHGGHIAVKSKEGEGTVFTIQLPLAPAVSDETHFHREEMKK